MRAVLAAAALALAALPALAVPKAEAVLKVGFPRGNPFAKGRLPELQIVDAKSQRLVASVRPKEWTTKSVTYATPLNTGKTYVLRWNSPGAELPFAELPVASHVEGTVVYRIPYVPRIRLAQASR
jgi:hypothetical protein